jgi:hypothetical protein
MLIWKSKTCPDIFEGMENIMVIYIISIEKIPRALECVLFSLLTIRYSNSMNVICM